MNDLGVLKNDALSLFDRVAAKLPADAGEQTVRRLDAAERRLRESGSVLVVLGQFDKGKSMLLNALLEEPGLLPAADGAATRLTVTVRPGPVERIVVRLADPDGRRPDEEREITRAEMAGYVLESAEPAADRARATELVVELPNAKLGEDLTILDTPGTGSLFSGHAIATLGVLPIADAVLYVTDALQPLLASELAFIKQIAEGLDLPAHPGRLLFAVTKTDQATDPAAAVADLRDRLKEVPGAQDAVVVPVSARLRLIHLADGDPQDLAASNLTALEAALWPAVRGYGSGCGSARP
ncbi:dynamin family protein [Catenulispora yoronensis]